MIIIHNSQGSLTKGQYSIKSYYAALFKPYPLVWTYKRHIDNFPNNVPRLDG